MGSVRAISPCRCSRRAISRIHADPRSRSRLARTSISLAVDTGGARLALPPLALETASPAIFVDRDGSPMLLDADNGVMLDAMRPAHSNSHIQVLATGLGRVKPEWPTGLPAPLENPPQVSATVHAYLDRSAGQGVTRAVARSRLRRVLPDRAGNPQDRELRSG